MINPPLSPPHSRRWTRVEALNGLIKFFKIAGMMFSISSVAAFALYFGVQALLGHPPIIAAVPLAHVAQYHNQYPIPYLLAVTAVFALVSAFWLAVIAPKFTRFRSLARCGVHSGVITICKLVSFPSSGRW
jgi:hypothetical protein